VNKDVCDTVFDRSLNNDRHMSCNLFYVSGIKCNRSDQIYQVQQKVAPPKTFLQFSQDWLGISERNFTHWCSQHIHTYRY